MSQHWRKTDGQEKTGYDTFDEAADHANVDARENVYECTVCGHFHVGHFPGRDFTTEADKVRRAQLRNKRIKQAAK